FGENMNEENTGKETMWLSNETVKILRDQKFILPGFPISINFRKWNDIWNPRTFNRINPKLSSFTLREMGNKGYIVYLFSDHGREFPTGNLYNQSRFISPIKVKEIYHLIENQLKQIEF